MTNETVMVLGDSTADTASFDALSYADRISVAGHDIRNVAQNGGTSLMYDLTRTPLGTGKCNDIASAWDCLVVPVLEDTTVSKAHIVVGINDARSFTMTKTDHANAIKEISGQLDAYGVPLYVGISNKVVDSPVGTRSLMADYEDWVNDDMLSECPNCCKGADLSGIDCDVSGCLDNVHPNDTSQATMATLVEAALAAEVCN